MFLYSEWNYFCTKIKELNIKTYTAKEALKINKKNKVFLIIKHDVETNVKKAYEIALIESNHNINSTYYVQSYLLKNNDNIIILKKMIDLGHEITYHYDVLDSNNGNYDIAINEFNNTLSDFENLLSKVYTVCPHGNPLKKRHGWTSKKDFFRNKKFRKLFNEIDDIVINPEKFVSNNFIYISDAGYKWNKIESISENDRKKSTNKPIGNINQLIFLLENSSNSIILSSHPHRWEKYKVIAIINSIVFSVLKSVSSFLYKLPVFRNLINSFIFS